MTVSPVAPIPFPVTPLTQITPLSYRDGYTYLNVLEDMRSWINDYVIPTINANGDILTADYNTALTALTTEINNAITTVQNDGAANVAQLEAAFNTFQVNLTDAMMGDAVSSGTSATHTALMNILSSYITAADAKNTYQPAVNVAQYGVLPGNTDAQNNAGLTAMVAAGLTNLFFPAGTYNVSIPLGGSLMHWIGINHIRLHGDRAILNDVTVHSMNGDLTSLFLFENCKDVEVTGIEYVGPILPTPTSQLGYMGAVIVRATKGTNGVKVDLRATNARYAVQTGDYKDPTLGQCRNFDVNVRGTMVGYGIAAYYADGIRHEIDIDGVHRAAYIAGCKDVYGHVRYKDQYIADTAYLITDVLIGGNDIDAQMNPPANPTTSRGCSDIDVTVVDKGSTVFQVSSRVAGIGLSRVDPCTFRNIRVRVYSKGDDTLSTRVGAFLITSAANTVWSRYVNNWEPYIILDNIVVSGVIDHSAATLPGNSGSEFYVKAHDEHDGTVNHAATVRNIVVDGLTILPSSAASPRPSWFAAYGLTGSATFRGLNTPGLGVQLMTNANVDTVFERCTFATLDISGVVGGSRSVIGEGTKAGALTCNYPITNVQTLGGSVGGASARIRHKEFTVALTGANTSWVGAISSGDIVLGVQGRVQTAITGATGFAVGVSGDPTRYAPSTTAVAAGTTFGSAQSTEVNPRRYTAGTDILVTATGANFTGGTLRLILDVLTFELPTA